MYKLRKKAEAGIGTLILFIALILVAAVAAGVLIQTASSLQSKALFTGSRAETQVSSQAIPIYMYGKDASSGSPRTLNRTFLKMKLAPGSDPIKLDDAVLQVDTQSSKYNLVYDSSVSCITETTGANGLFNSSVQGTYYGANYSIGSTQDDGYIERGDVLELCFALPANLGEGDDLRIVFTPKVGNPLLIETKAPDTMLDQRIQLFP